MRQIDGKFHIDDNGQIVSITGRVVPEDEPLFLLRAHDVLAILTLEHYRTLALDAICTNYHLDGITAALRNFREFARQHPERMKLPGSTRGD